MSRATIQNIEAAEENKLYGRTFRQLAEAFKLTPDALQEEIDRDDVIPAELLDQLRELAHAEDQTLAEFLADVVKFHLSAKEKTPNRPPKRLRNPGAKPADDVRHEHQPK